MNFHILQSSGVLSGATFDRINGVLEEAAEICSEKLILSDVDVVVMNVPWNVIPRIGINGYSYDAHQILLSLDCNHKYLKENFETTIKATLAHELHHCARSLARGSSHSNTYGGSLVAEGLACCFEEEIGEVTPFYAIECQGDALKLFSEKAKLHSQTKREDLPGNWSEWMFGRHSDETEFPYQCGYSTGYAIVRNWLDVHGISASSAAGVDENEVLNMWLDEHIHPFNTQSAMVDEIR